MYQNTTRGWGTGSTTKMIEVLYTTASMGCLFGGLLALLVNLLSVRGYGAQTTTQMDGAIEGKRYFRPIQAIQRIYPFEHFFGQATPQDHVEEANWNSTPPCTDTNPGDVRRCHGYVGTLANLGM